MMHSNRRVLLLALLALAGTTAVVSADEPPKKFFLNAADERTIRAMVKRLTTEPIISVEIDDEGRATVITKDIRGRSYVAGRRVQFENREGKWITTENRYVLNATDERTVRAMVEELTTKPILGVRVDEDGVTVITGTLPGPLIGTGRNFVFERRDGKWVHTRTSHWVS